MFRKFVFAGGLALALSIGAAGSAFALEAACLWDNLTAAKRTELLANYRTSGEDSLNSLPLVDSDLDGWTAHCGLTDDNAETAGMLLASKVIEHGVLVILSEDFGVAPASVTRAWNDVDAAIKRAALRDVELSLAEKETDGEGARAAADAVVKALKLPEEARLDVGLYLFAIMARGVVGES